MFDLNYFQKLPKLNTFLGGVDEVGRGPLAGPVVSACVLIHQKEKNQKEFLNFLDTLNFFGVSDSKKLNAEKRNNIIDNFSLQLTVNQGHQIQVSQNLTLKYFIKEVSVSEIDEVNILNASLLAMKSSFEGIANDNQGILLIDGNKKFKTEKNVQIEAIIKGDSKSLLIGLASVIAKVYRDHLMEELSFKYPQYSWEKNAGYGTKLHLDAIIQHGVTEFHRKTFKGVKEYAHEGKSI